MNTIIRTLVVFGMFVISLAEHRIGFDKYHKHVEMTNYLKKITNEFSNISSLYSIGTSVKGTNRPLKYTNNGGVIIIR